MGAIFGIIGPSEDADLQSMGRRLAHRGATLSIRRFSPRLALGAVGRNAAEQILQRGDCAFVCDATVCNRVELASELITRRREAPSASAGLLLEWLDAFGPPGTDGIDGEFSFALVDMAKERALFGRDYFGCRALYCTVLPEGALAFATEYKAFRALASFKPVPDPEMLQYVQGAKRLPVGRTLLRNVWAIQPGGTTELDATGRELSHHRAPPLTVNVQVRDAETAAELVRRKLTDAVRRRSEDLDPIGLALSGGIDSISVAFVLRNLYPKRTIHTFTAGYGMDDAEMATAADVAKEIGSVHHPVLTPPSLVQREMKKLAWHLEEPFARSEALQLMMVGRAAREHVDVLLSAQGSDGLFAGAEKYLLLHLIRRLPLLRHGLHEFYDLSQTGRPPQGLLGKLFDRLYFKGKVPPMPRVKGAKALFELSTLPAFGPEFINRSMAGGYQLGMCRSLQKFDRTFAASGIEYRSPFYDLDLVRSAYTITDRLKLQGRKAKVILREALAPLVPERFTQIRKFPQRMKYDIAFADALDSLSDTMLSPERVERRGIFEPEDIRRLRGRAPGQAYPPEAAMRLWTAILTEYWAEFFLDGGPLADEPPTAATTAIHA